MSEPAAEPAKKKGGKLPVIVIAVVLLAAGGFFGLKMKNGGKGKKPEVKLSKAKPMDLKEFLVNLQDHNVYCRTEISLGLAEGVDEASLKDQTPVIRDAVNGVLESETLQQVSTVAGLKLLKQRLARHINKALDEVMDKKDPAADTAASKDAPDAKSAKADSKQKGQSSQDAAPTHPDWDSQTGPVLKIYFDSFATQ